jgi:maltose-binding protein MalE
MVPCCNQATIEKYIVQIAAGRGPDIMQIPYACFAEMAAGGMLLPLNNYIDADKAEVDVNDIFPPAWEAVAYRGQYYGMPLRFKCPVDGVYSA